MSFTSSGINTMRTIIKKRWMNLEFIFQSHLSGLRTDLKILGVDLPEFDLRPFQFMVDWEAGEVNAAMVCSCMNAMDFEDTFNNKILKQLKRIDTKDVLALACIDDCIALMIKDVKPPFVDFLVKSQRMFGKMADLDLKQPPVLFAKFRHSVPQGEQKPEIKCLEVTPDQAMKMINFRKLDSHNAYIVNSHMIIFEQRDADNVKYVNWFLSSRSAISELEKILKIKLTRIFGDKEVWIKTVAQQLGAKI